MFDKLVELLEAVWDSLLPWVVLQPFERGVLVRLGKFNRVLGPGLHLVWPFHIDVVWHHTVTLSTHEIAGLCTTTKDDVAVAFDAIVSYEIVDIEKAILNVTGVEHAIIDTCKGIIGTELSEYTWAEILHGEQLDKLTGRCARRARKWGIEITAVQPAGVCRVKNIRLTGLPGSLNHGGIE